MTIDELLPPVELKPFTPPKRLIARSEVGTRIEVVLRLGLTRIEGTVRMTRPRAVWIETEGGVVAVLTSAVRSARVIEGRARR